MVEIKQNKRNETSNLALNDWRERKFIKLNLSSTDRNREYRNREEIICVYSAGQTMPEQYFNQ